MKKFLIKILGGEEAYLAPEGQTTNEKLLAAFFDDKDAAITAAHEAQVISEFFIIEEVYRKNANRGCGSHTTWCL